MVQEDLGWAAQAAAPAGNGCEPVSAASSCKKLLDYMLTCTKVQAAQGAGQQSKHRILFLLGQHQGDALTVIPLAGVSTSGWVL